MIGRLNLNRTVKAPAQKITIFHDAQSRLSQHLLSRMNKFNAFSGEAKISGWMKRIASSTLKFELEKREGIPTYQEYCYLQQECMAVHPQNLHSFEKVFPFLFEKFDVTINNSRSPLKRGNKRFTGDLTLLEEQEYYKSLVVNGNFNAPLIVDWQNNLVATDDQSLDKIMTNYLSCGIQEFHKDKIQPIQNINNVQATSEETPLFRESSKKTETAPTHPHVAEFADLF